MIDDDLPEYTGATQTTKADPKAKAKAAGTPVAIHTKPAEGASHPKIAHKAPADRLTMADVALNAATLELNAVRAMLQAAENAEADAFRELLDVLPKPSAEEVHREMLAKEQAAKVDRVSQGLPPTAPKVPQHNKSPIDVAAASRPRMAPGVASYPLRSPISRR